MYYIDSTYTYELNINKSKFITILTNVNKIDDVNEKLLSIKSEYKDADHYCYAYIIDSVNKYSDDKEPSGSAGSPILNVLAKKKLNHILCVVVRYFGGVKLGFSGLVRAYTNATVKGISLCKLLEYNVVLKISIEFDYEKASIINSLINTSSIVYKEYDRRIKYIFNISEANYNLIKDRLLIETINLKIENVLN